MNTATIDIGNSRVKTDYWADNGFLLREYDSELSISKISENIKNREIEGIIVSSVRKDTDGFINDLRKESGCVVVNFNNDEIRDHYELSHYRGNIGSDRIAAFLGAEDLFGAIPMMIVDMGTAITIDIAGKDGEFYGGNISLGLFTRLKALAEKTSKLPRINNFREACEFGVDTVSAIASGALNGVIGEISYSAELARKKYNIRLIVITGGDGEMIYDKLSVETKKFVDPYLVGRGLNSHLRKNYLNQQ